MKTIIYTEAENGARYLSTEGKQMDVIEEITKAEFKKRFPDVSTYGLDMYMPVFLENGIICIDKEWNGERYIINNMEIIPVYEEVGEDDFEIIGYYEA